MRHPLIRLIILLLSIAVSVNLARSNWSVWKRRSIIDQRKSEFTAAQEQNQRLKQQLEDIQSPEFIEKEARNTLGLVKSGETLVIVVTPVATQSGSETVKTETIPRGTGWGEWIKLFY